MGLRKCIIITKIMGIVFAIMNAFALLAVIGCSTTSKNRSELAPVVRLSPKYRSEQPRIVHAGKPKIVSVQTKSTPVQKVIVPSQITPSQVASTKVTSKIVSPKPISSNKATGQIIASKPPPPKSITSSKPASPKPITSSKRESVPASSSTVPAKSPAKNSIHWGWPVRGAILQHFHQGEKIKGIDIAGKAGTLVKAAASGTVVYSGNALKGYGNLLIIKHEDEFLTAYAHNQDLMVKEGERVQFGQPIATMGKTDSAQVKLHFEIRHKGKPLDPLKLLPKTANNSTSKKAVKKNG